MKKPLKKMPRFITLSFLTNQLFACHSEAEAVMAMARTHKIPLDSLSIYLLGQHDNGWYVRWFISGLRACGYLSTKARNRLRGMDFAGGEVGVTMDEARKIAVILTAPEKAPKKAKTRPRTRR